MQTDFLEEVFICLEIASPSMEAQDAHEHILVVGKVCHCLDILDMGVLTKLIVCGLADEVCTRYVPSMYTYVPIINYYNSVCTEYVFGTYLGRDPLPSVAVQEARTLQCGTDEKPYSTQCTG